MVSQRSLRRPCERRDPYAVPFRWGAVAETFCHHERRWLWVPSFAGTTWRAILFASSPSLPRRDDLDLVAGLQRRLGPAAFRQHIVIHGNRKMRAFVFELAEQRVDTGRSDLPRLAVDGHTHCITSLSMAPRCTKPSVSSASAGASRKPWR